MVFPWQFFLVCGFPIIVVGSLATMLTARPALRRSPIAILQGAIGERLTMNFYSWTRDA